MMKSSEFHKIKPFENSASKEEKAKASKFEIDDVVVYVDESEEKEVMSFKRSNYVVKAIHGKWLWIIPQEVGVEERREEGIIVGESQLRPFLPINVGDFVAMMDYSGTGEKVEDVSPIFGKVAGIETRNVDNCRLGFYLNEGARGNKYSYYTFKDKEFVILVPKEGQDVSILEKKESD